MRLRLAVLVEDEDGTPRVSHRPPSTRRHSASYVVGSKATIRASSTEVDVDRSVSTAAAIASSFGQP